MKKYKFFALAFAALTLGACSSDDVVDNGQGGAEWNSEGKGYINLAINLPTQASTRANDKFDDGTPEEYEVQDATLILFAGGKVNSAYDMTLNFSPEGSSTDNITTTAKITQEINSMDGNVQALVVLNHNNVFTVTAQNDLMVGGTSMKGKDVAGLNDAINAEITADDNWHTNGFLMSNAVLATAAGGTTAPTTATAVTLVDIDKTKIHESAAEAQGDPAANIYVERAESKVTLIASDGNTTETNMAYTIDGWALDNTNNSSKLVRTVAEFNTWKAYKSNATTLVDQYRFIGSDKVGESVDGTTIYYRVYWGDDYNYTAAPAGSFTTVGGGVIADDDLNKSVNGTVASYCFENTMDFANMIEANATRVIVKATFNGGKPFYVVDGDKTALLLPEDAGKEAAARLLNNPEFNAWAEANLTPGETLSSDTDFDVVLSTTAGTATVTSITLNDAGQAKLKADAAEYPTNAADLANSEINLLYYAGGESYYSVWVNHFGEDGTPWDAGETQAPGAGNIYPGGDANYLGRWGMLRNNWYELTVTSIRALGDPTVSTVTTEPIDKKESYISVSINVLSWAKRTQNADL